MEDATKRELIEAYLQNAGDEADGLTVRKFQERGKLLESDEYPGMIVFTVKRHRPICGDHYTPGLPMAAYETYWPRYVFNPFSKSLNEHGEVRPSQFHVNPVALAESHLGYEFFHLTVESDDGKYICSESVSGTTREVNDREEAVAFAEELLSDLDFSVFEEQIVDCFASEQEANKTIEDFRCACREQVTELAHEAWDSRDSF